MAERRMFSKTIINSDTFVDMPLSAQALYFHLCMRADDDGFVNNPKQIWRMIGAGEDDLKLLIEKQYIIPFASGIVAITHWKIHNYIQKDRYKETVYLAERASLQEMENKAYTLMDRSKEAEPSHPVHETDTQVKDSSETDRPEKDNHEKTSTKYETIIDGYTQMKDLKSALYEFAKMRDLINAPMTEKAFKMLLKRLDELTNNDAMKIEILNQSILKNWKSVYPLDNKKNNSVGANGVKLKKDRDTTLDNIF